MSSDGSRQKWFEGRRRRNPGASKKKWWQWRPVVMRLAVEVDVVVTWR